MEGAAVEKAVVDIVVSDSDISFVVGPTPYLDRSIEGVSVHAMVDR